MLGYEHKKVEELNRWQRQMLREPGFFGHFSKKVQDRINALIPERVHQAITVAIKQMMRGVLFGAEWTAQEPKYYGSLEEMDKAVAEAVKLYRNTAVAEGAVTGAGGVLLGLADFPLLLAIKVKMLFEIAAIYGYSVHDYRERLYLLHIFQLAFSSDKHRKSVFLSMQDWEKKSKKLPEDIHRFNWRDFQQEYRDYIDLAKLAQLIPVVGAPVGAVVNYRLIQKLGRTAVFSYHMRRRETLSDNWGK